MLAIIKLADVVGLVAFLITVIYTCLGMPVQIRKIYRAKSTGGLSLVTMLLMFSTFSSWVVYGLVKTEIDWYIVGSNFPGAVGVLVILGQFWFYRKTAPRK